MGHLRWVSYMLTVIEKVLNGLNEYGERIVFQTVGIVCDTNVREDRELYSATEKGNGVLIMFVL